MTDQGMKSVGCCVLCLVTFKDPRILPTCGHTFCLNCIKQYGKNKKTTLICPICRMKARIPAGGLEEFPKNYSLRDMLESSEFIGTEEPARVSPVQGIKLEGYTCTQHTENELQLYCVECSKAICLECVDAEHSSHKLFTISKIAADVRIQLQSDMERMKQNLSLAREEWVKTEETKRKLLRLFAERELDIKKEHERIKSYLEVQKKTLDSELMTLKINLMKQLEIEKQDVEAQLLSLTSFTAHVKEMIDGKDKKANFKVVESLKDLNSRSSELMQMKIKEPGTCSMTSVTFKPTDFLNTSFFASKQQNLIGTVEVKINSSNDDCANQLQLPSFGVTRKLTSPEQEDRTISDTGALLGIHQFNRTPDTNQSDFGSDSTAPDRNGTKDDDKHCVICMAYVSAQKQCPCKRKFCRKCIDDYFLKGQPKCPGCGKVFKSRRGNQPKGTMTSFYSSSWQHLPGYNDCGFIEINYQFPDGIQGENHPNPGQLYKGTHQIALLPSNDEGREVLRLLELAFDAGLVFTIGHSSTTGLDSIICNISHKTSRYGKTGYPDLTYLDRVKAELAAKGIRKEA